MKKYGLYIMMLAVALFCMTSCSDEEDNHLEGWMVANQNALNAIKGNSEYREIKSTGGEGSIYVKVLEKGDGTDSIYYTSTMQCYYKGMFATDYPEYNITKDYVFDKRLFDDGAPFSIYTGFTIPSSYGYYDSVISGWKTALQHMVKGDKWEVWIPYQLGYGRTGSGIIPGYSTLVFEMEVISVKGVDDK